MACECEHPCYDHCVWCDSGDEHLPDCPRATGVYVNDDDSVCSMCHGEMPHYMLVADRYMHGVYDCICLGCAINHAITA